MATTKVDIKRELRRLYRPGRDPEFVEVGEMAFLMVDGRGDPNTAASFVKAIEALFAMSYTIKFMVKASSGTDYTVMPLEALWWCEGPEPWPGGDKSRWQWTAMIMQPEQVTAELVEQARSRVRARRSLPALDLLRFERFDEAEAAQVMYLGPYSEEGPTIAALHKFIADHGRKLTGKHHEIYLGDPRRTAPEKLRTVIRQPVS